LFLAGGNELKFGLSEFDYAGGHRGMPCGNGRGVSSPALGAKGPDLIECQVVTPKEWAALEDYIHKNR
jgi:hypothetical protein